jgi:hypothetical protein
VLAVPGFRAGLRHDTVPFALQLMAYHGHDPLANRMVPARRGELDTASQLGLHLDRQFHLVRHGASFAYFRIGSIARPSRPQTINGHITVIDHCQPSFRAWASTRSGQSIGSWS